MNSFQKKLVVDVLNYLHLIIYIYGPKTGCDVDHKKVLFLKIRLEGFSPEFSMKKSKGRPEGRPLVLLETGRPHFPFGIWETRERLMSIPSIWK
jgi:hypothetical protein